MREAIQNANDNAKNLTIADGRARFGGGIFNQGTLTVTNSTFSNNSTSFDGGGGGIFNGGTATLSNTIVAYSPQGGDCSGAPINDGGYNISDDGSCVDPNVATSKTTDPKLDPNGLQDNGGPTQTIALQSDSPAVNYIPKGENGCGTEIKTDQRGVKRPQGKGCDVGSFEKR